MSQQVDGNTRTFLAGEALALARRVKLSAAETVVYADAGDDWIGTVEAAAASGAHVAIRLRSSAGTRKLAAAGAFSVGDVLYGAADGKVDDSPTGQPVGRALEAATADDDIVEVLSECDFSQASGDAVEVIAGAGDITALDLVYVSDQTDNVMTVLPAQSTSGGRFADFICPNAITAAAKGAALKSFLLSGIDTSSGSVGDPVYLSDATAGGYTLVKPTGTDKVQVVGRIKEDHATTGAILFDLSGPQQIVHDHSDASEGGQVLVTDLDVTGLDVSRGLRTNAGGTAVESFNEVIGVAGGYKVARGVHTTVAASDTVVTGLTTVVSIVATLESDPSVDPMFVSADIGDQAGSPAAGSVLINTWKPTAVDNCTPTAATTFSKVVNWVAVGT